MHELLLRFTHTYQDYIRVKSSRFSSVLSSTHEKHGESLPQWAKVLLKPLTVSWATYTFFIKKRRIGEVDLTINESGIVIFAQGKTTHVEWSSVLDIEEHKTGYILMGRNGNSMLIPRRAMSDSQRAALEFFVAAWRTRE